MIPNMKVLNKTAVEVKYVVQDDDKKSDDDRGARVTPMMITVIK